MDEEQTMEQKERRLPGPDHPITIAESGERYVVRLDGHVIADTTGALVLSEANYPAVPYFLLADVDTTLLRESSTTTYCPYKGDASYYSIAGPERVVEDAIWYYAEPYPAVAEIAGYVAFYPERVDISGS